MSRLSCDAMTKLHCPSNQRLGTKGADLRKLPCSRPLPPPGLPRQFPRPLSDKLESYTSLPNGPTCSTSISCRLRRAACPYVKHISSSRAGDHCREERNRSRNNMRLQGS